jgi:3-deoxy-D-manno-octulosonate 8-phosphate phosphatase (KDO 8-P phosphatase)
VKIEARAARIRLLLFDVDGVLTDGKVLVHADGTESKAFAIRDGIAMVWAQRAGLKVGLLSARTSATTRHRAAQLGITLVHQGVASKLEAYERILAAEGVGDAEVAYMADDIVDLAVIRRAGLSAAPADAVAEVRSIVHWVSGERGGSGAVRELIETVLRAQKRWDAIVAAYAGEPGSAEAGVVFANDTPGRDRVRVKVTPERRGARASGAGVAPRAKKP